MFAGVLAMPLTNNPATFAMQETVALVKKKHERLLNDEDQVLEGFITCFYHQN